MILAFPNIIDIELVNLLRNAVLQISGSSLVTPAAFAVFYLSKLES